MQRNEKQKNATFVLNCIAIQSTHSPYWVLLFNKKQKPKKQGTPLLATNKILLNITIRIKMFSSHNFSVMF